MPVVDRPHLDHDRPSLVLKPGLSESGHAQEQGNLAGSRSRRRDSGRPVGLASRPGSRPARHDSTGYAGDEPGFSSRRRRGSLAGVDSGRRSRAIAGTPGRRTSGSGRGRRARRSGGRRRRASSPSPCRRLGGGDFLRRPTVGRRSSQAEPVPRLVRTTRSMLRRIQTDGDDHR